MKIEITKGVPYPLGIHEDASGINFAYVSSSSDCGIVLYEKKSREERKRIPFSPEHTVGMVQCMHIKGLPLDSLSYCFYEDGKPVTDERGHAFLDGYRYGESNGVTGEVRQALFPTKAYDWEGDRNPLIPYEESICYCLHVRGFTRHASSKVKAKGTFCGLAEKIPYLKELGVTTLELQPVYEFDEWEERNAVASAFAVPADENRVVGKLNYWGYKKGYYYSPKNSYAYSKDAVTEFKNLIKELHKNGMEAVLQFFFTEDVPVPEIADILRYWVMEYHVDGFHLKGAHIVPELLADDPALARTKLWYYGFPERQGKAGKENAVRLLASYKDDYRYDMRRFLKGDEGMLQAVMYHLRQNPAGEGQINFLTNYDGFTMMDLVSYDRKHNEENGEENKDGNDYNASWNCGQEGPARKRAVIKLRHKQIKNAWMLLFLSQGTPLFFMGDEFGNSQKGNNNPYCQDNETTWINWKNLESNKALFEFVKMLISLRKAHPVLRQERELRLMDYGACGYPDLSYHGEAPWRPDTASYSRQLGVMYCGKYAFRDKRTPDDSFYVAYNMHWEPHSFAMPKLPKGQKWQICITTDETVCSKESGQGQFTAVIPPRCICLFISVGADGTVPLRNGGKDAG